MYTRLQKCLGGYDQNLRKISKKYICILAFEEILQQLVLLIIFRFFCKLSEIIPYLPSSMRPKPLTSIVAFTCTRGPRDNSNIMINSASSPHISLSSLSQQVHHGQSLFIRI